MKTDRDEEVFAAAEDLARAATQGWQTIYELAKGAEDAGFWALEEAAWNSFRFAENARQLAWQLRDRMLSEERRRAREGAMAKLVMPSAQSTAAPQPAQAAQPTTPVAQPAQAAQPAQSPPTLQQAPEPHGGPILSGEF